MSVWAGKSIRKTHNHQTNQTRRPANPPARLAFRQRTQRSKQQNTKNQTKTGPEPKQNTHKIDLMGRRGLSTASLSKTCQWIKNHGLRANMKALACVLTQVCATLYKKTSYNSALSFVASFTLLYGPLVFFRVVFVLLLFLAILMTTHKMSSCF